MRVSYYNNQSGGSFIGLITVLAIVGVLAGLSLPAFSGLVARSSLENGIGALQSDLRYARYLAQRRGVPVRLCASADGENCQSVSDWRTGWIVYIPEQDAADPSTVGQVVRVHGATDADLSIKISSSAVAQPGFSSSGFRIGPGSVFDLSYHASQRAQLIVQASGLLKLEHNTES